MRGLREATTRRKSVSMISVRSGPRRLTGLKSWKRRMASLQKADAVRRTRAVRVCAPEVVIDRRADGTLYLNSPHRLDPYAERLTDRLVYWAETAPDRVFMAERDGDSWRTITYRQTLLEMGRIGAALLKKKLS